MDIKAIDLGLKGKKAENIEKSGALNLLTIGHKSADTVRNRSNLLELYDPGMTNKEFANHARMTQRLLGYIAKGQATPKRLARIKREINSLPHSWRCAIDMWGPPHPEVLPPRGYVELSINLLDDLSMQKQQAVAEELLQYVNPFCDDLALPGRGGANRRATRLTWQIQTLADHFQRALPGYALSADPASLFHRYVHLWMQRAMDADECPAERDASRQIKNALADLNRWHPII